jgi:hypothetical protein
MLVGLGRASPPDSRPSYADVQATLGGLAPSERSNVVSGMGADGERQYLSWIQYLQWEGQQLQVCHERLICAYPVLPADLILLLRRSRNSPLFQQIDMMMRFPIKNDDLSCLSDLFHKYGEVCLEIDDYWTRLSRNHQLQEWRLHERDL